jgi:hypothetical protein
MSEQTTLVAPPPAIARMIGADPDYETEPATQLDWALHWADKGLHVFPCKRGLGLPITERWWKEATLEKENIINWWTQWPAADIGCVPAKSGHYVISVLGQHGHNTLRKLESEYGDFAPEFTTETRWGGLHMWFRGCALSSRDLIGAGIHVFGAGTFLYLPHSWAPLAEE